MMRCRPGIVASAKGPERSRISGAPLRAAPHPETRQVNCPARIEIASEHYPAQSRRPYAAEKIRRGEIGNFFRHYAIVAEQPIAAEHDALLGRDVRQRTHRRRPGRQRVVVPERLQPGEISSRVLSLSRLWIIGATDSRRRGRAGCRRHEIE